MREEAAPTIDAAPGQDLAAYADALLARFANPALHHRLIQIAMDGSQKIPQRWLETLAHNEKHGRTCPAIREGLPLRRAQWQDYLDWAVEAFRLSASGVRDETQIHTHMCYSEFNDVIEAIAAMDADVITIETSRSDMELLEAFKAFDYPNDIGPGVYDIHSPRVPDTAEMVKLMTKAVQRIPAERLWVNPDCGLKTRAWPETEAALVNMVAAARQLRTQLA